MIGVDGVRTPWCFSTKRPFERTSCAMQVGALHLAFGGRTAMHICYASLQRVDLSRWDAHDEVCPFHRFRLTLLMIIDEGS